MTDLKTIGDDLTGLIDDIRKIDNNDELQIVWDAMRNQWQRNTEKALTKFYVGQDVECKFKDGNYYPAVVEKINKKTVGIKVSLPYNRVKNYNVNPRWLRDLDTN